MSTVNTSPSRTSSSRTSPSRISPSRTSPSRTSPSRRGSIKKGSNQNSQSKTLKLSQNTLASVNTHQPIYSDYIDLFKTYFEGSFHYHDSNQKTYAVTNTMLMNYIQLKNILTSNSASWIDIFKNHRYLLYLDQFINLINMCKTRPTTIENFAGNNSYYFSLPIAAGINGNHPSIATNKEEISVKTHQMLTEYSDRIYKTLNTLATEFNRETTRNINSMSFISAHGGVYNSSSFIKVPNDIIIAFITPQNKYAYQNVDDLKSIKDSLTKILTTSSDTDKQSFFNNPACYFRTNECLKHTVYYYPGQYIPNYELSIIKDENTIDGIYFNLSDEKVIQPFFTASRSGKTYNTKIQNILAKSYRELNGHILYIHCCRKSDIELPKQYVELIYRYEHIITYLNMSYCSSFEIKTKNNYKCEYAKKPYPNIEELAENKANKSLFYDSALSYTFSTNPVKKHIMFAENNSTFTDTLRQIKNRPTIQINTIHEVFIYLLDTIKLDTSYNLDKILKKIKLLFEQTNIHIMNLLDLLTRYKLIERLHNVLISKGHMMDIDILVPLFINHPENFMDLFKFIEIYDLSYKLDIFVSNLITGLQSKNIDFGKFANKTIKDIVTTDFDTNLGDDLLKNVIYNRTNILYLFSKNENIKPYCWYSKQNTVFVGKLLNYFWTKNINFDYRIFSISRFSNEELKKNVSDSTFNYMFKIDIGDEEYKDIIPNINTPDDKINKYVNDKKNLIYYAILKNSSNFINYIFDFYKNNMTTNNYNSYFSTFILYIILLSNIDTQYNTYNILIDILKYYNKTLHFNIIYSALYLWLNKLLEQLYLESPSSQLGKYYKTNNEAIKSHISELAYNNIELNINLTGQLSMSIEDVIINFMSNYTKILGDNNKVIPRLIPSSALKLLLK